MGEDLFERSLAIGFLQQALAKTLAVSAKCFKGKRLAVIRLGHPAIPSKLGASCGVNVDRSGTRPHSLTMEGVVGKENQLLFLRPNQLETMSARRAPGCRFAVRRKSVAR
jgi:hypothetical protein